MFTKKHPKEGLNMDTLQQTSTNSRMVEAFKLAKEKPTLASINLMYAWAFAKKPESGATYIGMLEEVFDLMDSREFATVTTEGMFSRWIDGANDKVSSGYDKYKAELERALLGESLVKAN